MDEEAEPAGSDQVVAQLHGQGGGPGLPDHRFTGYILLHQGDYIIKLFLRPLLLPNRSKLQLDSRTCL